MIPHPKLLWRERLSDSPFIESVWTATTPIRTQRTVIADPCIGLALVKSGNASHVILTGPKTKPWRITLESGYTCTTIRLKPGVCVKEFLTKSLINNSLTFPADSGGRFWLKDTRLQFPHFDDAEAFVDQLQHLGHLGYAMPPNDPTPSGGALSARSHARRVQRTTGLSPYQLYQLRRMHQALRLLKQGVPAVDVASELAFVDQPHLIRASRQFLGHTPKQLLELPQAP